MVTICPKKFANTREKLLLSDLKKKQENKELEKLLNRLSERRGNSVLCGTSVPNSTFRRSIDSEIGARKNTSDKSIKEVPISTTSLKIPLQDFSRKNEEQSSAILVPTEPRRPSLLSETSSLEELKELKALLHKSSYVPKEAKQAKTRRPTIKKIKEAIEKEKQIVEETEESPEPCTEPETCEKAKKKESKARPQRKVKKKINSAGIQCCLELN